MLDIDGSKLDIKLDAVVERIEVILKNYGQDLDPQVIYHASDAEWGKSANLYFDEWLQSCSIVFFWHKDRWNFHIHMFHKGLLPNLNFIIDNFQHESVTHHAIDNVRVNNQSQIMADWFQNNCSMAEKEVFIMKYSPLDLTAYLGVEQWLNLLSNKVVEQKRCIKFNTGGYNRTQTNLNRGENPYQTSIRDIHGLSCESLAKQAASVGVELLAKSSMDDYKSDMLSGYTLKPLTATIYNMGDTLGTMEVFLAYIPLLNNFAELMGIDKYIQFNASNLPFTTGSMVAKLYSTYIEYLPAIIADLPHEYRVEKLPNLVDFSCSQDDLLAWRLALRRFPTIASRIDPKKVKLYDKTVRLMSKCNCLEDYKNTTVGVRKGKKKEYVPLSEWLLTKSWDNLVEYDNRGQACAKVWGSDTNTTLPYQAITQGGRCHNSCPEEFRAEGLIADSDMPGAYVSILRRLVKAIGLPTTLQKNRNNVGEVQERNFMKTYKKLFKQGKLRNGMWVADVSTDGLLNFDQDLWYSSLQTTENKINKCVNGIDVDDVVNPDTEPEDVKKISSTMSLEINRLVHAKITSHSLEVFNNVASNIEKSSFNKEVYYNSLIYFDNADRREHPIEWAKEILQSEVAVVRDKNGDAVDNRSRAYFPYPLEIFIGRLADARKQVKSARNKLRDTEAEYKRLDAIQNFYKLVCNTTYGVLASIYFNVSDTVVSNNITDCIRTSMWLKSKALRTRQEITDGGWYDLLKMPYFSGRKPTMNDFAKWNRWNNSRDGKKKMWTAPLAGYTEDDLRKLFNDYIEIDKRLSNAYVAYNANPTEVNEGIVKAISKERADWESHLDNKVENFIKDFWKPYGIDYLAGVEHKTKHFSWRASYNGKGNYMFDSITKGILPASRRGARILSSELIEKGYVDNPVFLELKELLKYGEYLLFKNSEYDVFLLTKIGEWCNDPNDSEIRDYLPGQARIQHRESRQINNAHIRMTSTKDKQGRVKHVSDTVYNRRTVIRGQRRQFYEKYLDDGAEILYRKMANNSEIRY